MIDLSFAKGKSYYVVGLARTGLASVAALVAAGAQVLAWDDKEARRKEALKFEGVEAIEPEALDFNQVDALILSPGIPHTHPEPHPAAAKAKLAKVEIISDIELLLRALPDRRIVAITGTNGKSTTTALVGHILKAAGLLASVGGNLGVSVLDLEDPGANAFYVIEFSSYQLELVPSLEPSVSVWLNISPDHLERHGGLEGYVSAKRAVFGSSACQGTAIVGADDAHSQAEAERLRWSDRKLIEISGEDAVIGGVYAQDDWLVDARSGAPTRLIKLDRLATLPGEHNAQNAAAAYAVCRTLGLSKDVITEAMISFPGLAHRQELLGQKSGVRFVNDSKATNAEAAEKALSCYRNIYWIAGGRAKDGGVSELTSKLGDVRTAYLIGESAGVFAQQLDGVCATKLCRTLEAAIRQAILDAEASGGESVILLSPAAASFDQYPSFEARGDHFRALVQDHLDPGSDQSSEERRAS